MIIPSVKQGWPYRSAKAVMAISLESDLSGSLSLLDANGNILVWEHNGVTKQVLFGVTTATDVLATDVEELQFVGFQVDGNMETTDPGLIHLVECRTKVNIIRPAGTEEVVASNRAWLRAW